MPQDSFSVQEEHGLMVSSFDPAGLIQSVKSFINEFVG